MLCDAGYKPVVFAEIRPPKPKINKIQFVHVSDSAFSFGAYVKALKGFKAFYFFGFGVHCEMAVHTPRTIFLFINQNIILCCGYSMRWFQNIC